MLDILSSYFAKQDVVRRTQELLEKDPRCKIEPLKQGLVIDESAKAETAPFASLIREANFNIKGWQLLIFSILLGCIPSLYLRELIHFAFLPVVFLSAASLPFLFLDRRAEQRAMEFSEDFPNLLLATASSLKAGMTVYAALERAIRLLPEDRIVRLEVQKLLKEITKGLPREIAVARFADTIRRPDTALFRSAFLLVLESGGRFAPTLERLALVSRDRSTLIRTAGVRCSSMRMTANILLALTPLIVFMVAVRTENYFEIIRENPTANILATLGVAMILGSYLLLRRMSAFRP